MDLHRISVAERIAHPGLPSQQHPLPILQARDEGRRARATAHSRVLDKPSVDDTPAGPYTLERKTDRLS